MQRDIENYTQKYLEKTFSDFESYMVAFRRNKVLEFLIGQKAQNILEIGCGMESIAKYYKDFKSFTIVEPSKVFAQKAREDFAQENQRIKVINDFIQPQVSSLQNVAFDCILLSSLLHEVENPKEFLTSIIPLCPPPLYCTSMCLMHILSTYFGRMNPDLSHSLGV